MIIGRGSDMWNTQLISEYLLDNGKHMYFKHSSQHSHTIFMKIIAEQI